MSRTSDNNPSEDVFREIHSAYVRRLRAFLHAMLGPTPDLEDVLQEALIGIHQVLPDFDPRRGTMDSLFFTIARNAALAYKRKRRWFPTDPGELAQSLEAPEIEDRFFALIAELPLPQRQALALRFVFGLDSEEAAKVMGRTAESVRKLQSRSYQTMRSRSGDGPKTPTERSSYPAVRFQPVSRVVLGRRFAFAGSA